jgi:hypothetical protein
MFIAKMLNRMKYIKMIRYTNVGGLVPDELIADTKYAIITIHGIPPEIVPRIYEAQSVFSVFWLMTSIKCPNIIIIALRTKIMTSDHNSHIPTLNPIKMIMTELENTYSYHLYGFIPFFKYSLYFSLRGYAIAKWAIADISGNEANITPR